MPTARSLNSHTQACPPLISVQACESSVGGHSEHRSPKIGTQHLTGMPLWYWLRAVVVSAEPGSNVQNLLSANLLHMLTT